MQENKNHICHYTSAEGLMGILNSKQLWATHPRYLNDTGEFNAAFNYIFGENSKLKDALLKQFKNYYFRSQVSQFARSLLDFTPSIEDEKFIEGQVDDLISQVHKNMREDTFVTSFTNFEGIDSNTHWLSYAHNITGYCIVFDKNELIKIDLDGVDYQFENVEYGVTPDGILEKVVAIIHDDLVLINEMSKLSEDKDGNFDDQLALRRAKAIMKINNLLGIYKQASYRNELEIRLLISKLDSVKNNNHIIQKNDLSTFPDLQFRTSSNGTFIPYQPVPIDLNAIKKIIVRSDSHIESKVKSTEMLLRKFDVEAIVEQSTATLRTTL